MADDGILTRVGQAISSFGKRAVPTQTLGSSDVGPVGDLAGSVVWAPDRTQLSLIGQRRWDTFEEMLRDVSIVAAGTRLFLNLIANAVWTVNPPEDLNGNEEPVAQEYADQAYDALFGMTSSWSAVVRKIAMFRMVGFAIMEWTAKRNDDGSIGFLDIEHRPQRTIIRWLRDASGTIEGVVQRVQGRSEVTIPRTKIVYAVDDLLTDHPEGVGLFRHLAVTSDRLKMFLDLEEIGFTTDLRGIPIGRAPLAEERKKVEDAGPAGSDARGQAEVRRQSRLRGVKDFIEKHIRNRKLGLLLPSDTYSAIGADGTKTPSNVPKWSLELLNGEGTAFEQMASAINRMNQEMARILGVEHLLLGSDGSGSLALARSKVGTFYLTVTSTLQDLVEVIDRDILDPLAELNGWPKELRPQMGVNEISDRDIEQVADVLAKLAQAGAVLMPDDPAIGEMRDMVGLSRPNEDTLALQLDASLNPGRNDPQAPPKDPNAPNPEKPLDKTPEDRVTKRVARRRPKRRSAWKG